MKKMRRVLNVVFLVFTVLFSSTAWGQTDNDGGIMTPNDSILAQMDSVEISLLTCSPGEQIWSLYGHTAIRYEDKAHALDVAINYGLFDFNQKNFIVRFVFGRTDYQMGIIPFSMFLLDYAKEGRSVIQQTLNLTRDEKAAITQAIAANYEPANRTYRYNYFYDNCTTRARDILVSHLDGKVEYAVNPSVTVSYRDMIHQWNGGHRWMRFGKDLLLGVGADQETSFAQQQFLPDTLRKDFDKAMVVSASGEKHWLVSRTTEILRSNGANVKSHSGVWDVITPRIFFLALLIVTLLLTAVEYKRKKTFWLYDVVLLTLDGLAGLALLMMVFSEHPTVRVNFQIFLLNPLSIVFVYSVGNSIVKKLYNRYWNVLCGFIVLFLICGFFQHYAEGMYFLACTLLVRIGINRRIYYKR